MSAKQKQEEAASQRREKVRQAIINAGFDGIATRQLCAKFSLGVTTVEGYLRVIAADGRIESSWDAGPRRTWGPPGTRAYHEALRNRGRAAKAAEEAEIDGFARKSIKRSVPAKAGSFVKSCPVSVWELAEWAA